MYASLGNSMPQCYNKAWSPFQCRIQVRLIIIKISTTTTGDCQSIGQKRRKIPVEPNLPEESF